MAPHQIAVIGIGKIARDQHLPVIAKDPRFRLVGVVSQSGARVEGIPTFRTAAEAYAALPALEAVTISTPPHVRHALAREALDAGKAVMLEKPPTPTIVEMRDLAAYAALRGRVIFATWHSRYNAAVAAARRRLAGARLSRLAIEWKEDVRRWHPGQEWIWDAGNFGVFDPGVNALSVLTAIAPAPIFVRGAQLDFPANRETPIAASLVFSTPAAETPDAPLTAEFDWRQEGEQCWNIDIETAAGERLSLTHGGSRLLVDGALAVAEPMAEYEGLYDHFAGLIAEGRSAMDASPFELVADAFLIGRRRTVAPFHW